ncbi:MAG: hypothetical protein IPJ94_00105 [Chloroflexi bacterium]|nr:hypothetical protein [Chloroflexota bacterium]
MNDLVKLQDGPLTKAAIQQAGQGYAEALLEEWALPPLSAYVRLRALRDALDAALAEVEGAAMDAADLNPGETVHGVRSSCATARAGGTTAMTPRGAR